jgi:hypothetical protein
MCGDSFSAKHFPRVECHPDKPMVIWQFQEGWSQRGSSLEARVGIEPTHKGFADLSLTTWVPRLNLLIIAKIGAVCQERQKQSLQKFGEETD